MHKTHRQQHEVGLDGELAPTIGCMLVAQTGPVSGHCVDWRGSQPARPGALFHPWRSSPRTPEVGMRILPALLTATLPLLPFAAEAQDAKATLEAAAKALGDARTL